MGKETFSIYDLKLIDILPEQLSADLQSRQWRFNFQKRFVDLTIQDLSDLSLPLMGATEGRVIGGVVLSFGAMNPFTNWPLKNLENETRII